VGDPVSTLAFEWERMADIFISYKREDQQSAKRLAEALEHQGWSVWWDPELRAGERFDDVIEVALQEARCVIVIWSRRSIESAYVKDEASYALECNKLVPLKIEEVRLPFRFDRVQTPQLIGWNGAETDPNFQILVCDLASILGTPLVVDERRNAEEKAAKQMVDHQQKPTDQDDRGKADPDTIEVEERKEEQAEENQEEETGASNGKVAYKQTESKNKRIGKEYYINNISNQVKDFTLIQKLIFTVLAFAVFVYMIQLIFSSVVAILSAPPQGPLALPGPAPDRLSRAQWQEVQSALNDIGFDAGPVDGVPGSRTHAAIIRFQRSRGFATGELLEYQRSRLLADGRNARVAARDHPGGAQESTTQSIVTPDMVIMPAGCFEMGSPSGEGYDHERPQHNVCVKRYEIGKYEVTFEEYDRFAEAVGRIKSDDHGWGRGRRPVINLSWDDAFAYAAWLADKTGKRYRLPSEAEWEYAARAGTTTPYWWGYDVRQNGRVWANCNGCGSAWDNAQTAPVGSFPANPAGLYDTSGNAFEWVMDCWHPNYYGAPADDRAWREEGGGNCNIHVVRGGTLNHDAMGIRSASRGGTNGIGPGFRLARDL